MLIKPVVHLLVAVCIATTNLLATTYTNGNIISEIDFSSLELNHRIVVLDQKTSATMDALPKDIRSLLVKLYSSTNEVLKELLSLNISNEGNQKKLRDYLKEDLGVSGELDLIEKEGLVSESSTGQVVLKNADLMESSMVQIEQRSERMIELSGKVTVLFSGYTIHANRVLVNSETKDLFAEGDIQLLGVSTGVFGEKLILNTDTMKGYIQRPHGYFGQTHFRAEQAKINGPGHVTIENGQATYDTNREPFFHIDAARLENYGEDKIIVDNIVMYVHNHPFFYWPFFMQHPFGTGIQFTFGRSEREGWYFLNNVNFMVPVLKKINFDFNFFQNLGQYMRFANENSFEHHRYMLDFATARYYEGAYLDTVGTAYSAFDDDLNRDVTWRFKLNYDHNVAIATKAMKEKGIATLLNWKWHKTWNDSGFTQSDAFFTSDLESRNLESLELNQLLNTADSEEGRWYRSPIDTDRISFNMRQNLPGNTFFFSGDWRYGNFLDTSKEEEDPNRYKGLLSVSVFPHFNYTHSGTIDPSEEESRREVFLNLNYNLSTDYRLTTYYTNAVDLSQSEINRRENFLRTSGGLSRHFLVDKNNKGEYLKSFTFTYRPSLSLSYQRQWGGEEVNENIVNVNNNNTFLSLSQRNSLTFNFPSQHTQKKLSEEIGYKPMIPNFQLGIAYNFAKSDDLEEADKGQVLENWQSHDLGLSGGLGQKGYGLFFIPTLDYQQNLNMGFSYDLKPERSEDGIGYSDTWSFSKKKILNWSGGYKFNLLLSPRRLAYSPLTFSYNLNYEVLNPRTKGLYRFYNSEERRLGNLFRSQSFSLNLEYQSKNKRPMFHIASLYARGTWNYNFRVENYVSDRMSFTAGIRLHFLRYWDFEFRINSFNNNAFRYLPKKVERFNKENGTSVEHVKFFRDIWNSFGLARGNNDEKLSSQQGALFKIQSMNMTLYHDLGSWELNATYSISPRQLRRNSLRGFYLEQKFYMTIQLKSEFNLPSLRDTLRPWEIDFTPEELRENTF